MRVLDGTCVISEIVRPQGAQKVKDRVRVRHTDTFLCAITINEMARGNALLPPSKSAMDTLLPYFRSNKTMATGFSQLTAKPGEFGARSMPRRLSN